MWVVSYNNSSGLRDDDFFTSKNTNKVYEVTDGKRIFETSNKDYAIWLCNNLNKMENNKEK